MDKKMQQVVRNEVDDPWTEEEAESYANAHNLTIIMINGRTLWVSKND